jgi:hypothetical protein
MAKGAFYPDLFCLQLYQQNPGELQDLLKEFIEVFLTYIKQGNQNKLKDIELKLFVNYDFDSIVALGSLVHEYYHYLQYTTRTNGLLYYNCRYEQFLITKKYLEELKEFGEPLTIPLTNTSLSTNKHVKEIGKKWWNMWGPYEATIISSGLGCSQNETDNFKRHVEKNLSKDWNPEIKYSNKSDESFKRECTMELLLETEAEIVTFEVLRAYFPGKWSEVMNTITGNDPSSSSLAIPLIMEGLSQLVPFLMDYTMQSPFVSKTGLRSQVQLFFIMLDIVRDKYKGIDIQDIIKYSKEIEDLISKETGIKKTQELITEDIEVFRKINISNTSIGRMLLRCIDYRKRNPNFFIAPYAFIFIILGTMPSTMWMNFNLGILDKEQHMMGLQFGHRLSNNDLDIEILRHLLWGEHEIALRDGKYICPECEIKARYSECTGNCEFISIIKENFNIDLFTNKWI